MKMTRDCSFTLGKVSSETLKARTPHLEKSICQSKQGHEVITAQPMTSSKMVQPKYLFQLSVLLFGPPAGLDKADKSRHPKRPQAQLMQPAPSELLFFLPTIDPQSFCQALRFPLAYSGFQSPKTTR